MRRFAFLLFVVAAVSMTGDHPVAAQRPPDNCPVRYRRDPAAAAEARRIKKAELAERGVPARYQALLDRIECVGCIEDAAASLNMLVIYTEEHAPRTRDGQPMRKVHLKWSASKERHFRDDLAAGRIEAFYVFLNPAKCSCCPDELKSATAYADWNPDLEANMSQVVEVDDPNDLGPLPEDLKKPEPSSQLPLPDVEIIRKPARRYVHVTCDACQPLADQWNMVAGTLDDLWDRKASLIEQISRTVAAINARQNDITNLRYQQQFESTFNQATNDTIDALQKINDAQEEGLPRTERRLQDVERKIVETRARMDALMQKIQECEKACRKTTTATSTAGTTAPPGPTVSDAPPTAAAPGVTTGSPAPTSKTSAGDPPRRDLSDLKPDVRYTPPIATLCKPCAIVAGSLNAQQRVADELAARLELLQELAALAHTGYEMAVGDFNAAKTQAGRSPDAEGRARLEQMGMRLLDASSRRDTAADALEDVKTDLADARAMVQQLRDELTNCEKQCDKTNTTFTSDRGVGTVPGATDPLTMVGDAPLGHGVLDRVNSSPDYEPPDAPPVTTGGSGSACSGADCADEWNACLTTNSCAPLDDDCGVPGTCSSSPNNGTPQYNLTDGSGWSTAANADAESRIQIKFGDLVIEVVIRPVQPQRAEHWFNPLGLLATRLADNIHRWHGSVGPRPIIRPSDLAAVEKYTGGQSIGLPKGVHVLLTDRGGSTGKTLAMQVLNLSGQPVRLSSLPFAIEPIQRDAQQRVQQAFTRLAKAAPANFDLAGYCVEFLKLPPAAGQIFRLAPAGVQKKFAAMSKVLRSAYRVRHAGLLNPDSDPAAYTDAIKQWSVWAVEQRFNQSRFTEAFLGHTRRNVEAAGRQWNKSAEDTIRKVSPNRWRDIAKVLAGAGLPVPP